MQALPTANAVAPFSPSSASAAEDVTPAAGTAEAGQDSPLAFDRVLAAQIDSGAVHPELLLEAANADLVEEQEPEVDPLAVLNPDASLGAQLIAAAVPTPAQGAKTLGGAGMLAELGATSDEVRVDAAPATLGAGGQEGGIGELLPLEAAGKALSRAGLGGDSELKPASLGTVEELGQPHAAQAGAESPRTHAGVRALEGTAFNPRAIPEPVRSPQWGEALGQRVVWMAKENVQVVYLQVEPPNLGPLEVQLRLSNDQANLMFVSSHSSVREAISGSLAKLDEMLSAGGVSLGSVSVNTQSSSQDPGQRSTERQSGSQAAAWELDARTGEAVRPPRPLVVGMVDTFA